jgi:hypothetical protein
MLRVNPRAGTNDRLELPDDGELETIRRLDELVRLVEVTPNLYVRWSHGPAADSCATSTDELTGVELPGLSANSLAVEPWWGDRPAHVWLARRLYDYRHLGDRPGVVPWVFEGEELARGPDNEPVVRCIRPIARLSDGVVRESATTVERFSGSWGPLARQADESSEGDTDQTSDAGTTHG